MINAQCTMHNEHSIYIFYYLLFGPDKCVAHTAYIISLRPISMNHHYCIYFHYLVDFYLFIFLILDYFIGQFELTFNYFHGFNDYYVFLFQKCQRYGSKCAQYSLSVLTAPSSSQVKLNCKL